MKKFLILMVVSGFFLIMFPKGIKNSKHDLSSGGTGNIKTSETANTCIFCHTSHTAGISVGNPLWNREESHVEYILYESSTLYSIPGQPDGDSKLCLSCHDGTISLGHVRNRRREFSMKNTVSGKIPEGNRANFGVNLSDDHPVSFDSRGAVSASPDLVDPSGGDPVRYDKSGKIQCTSCHDPHKQEIKGFLVKTVLNGSLCKTCHQPVGFSGISTHDISYSTWSGSGINPWSHTSMNSVASNSCQNCHQPHTAPGSERLLTHKTDSEVCLVCHNGNVGLNIKGELGKASSHNAEFYNNIHDPSENIISAPIHAQCVDCHNPHKVNSSGGSAPTINGRMEGVSGMTIDGSLISEAQFEYEVCFKCHGQERYNNNTVYRQYPNQNIRTAFLPSNNSFHGVAATGTSNYVPSLRPGWSESSRLFCTDCHNNNNAKKNGGSGPNGPHGSTQDHILERRYVIAASLPYMQSNFDLCWKCHRPGIILREDQTSFKYHKKHVEEKNTPCSVCHDPHGSRNNPGLINFDTSAVFPNLNGDLKFEVIGNKGYCYLQCHGDDHSPKEYEK